jgi:hypothetical protein
MVKGAAGIVVVIRPLGKSAIPVSKIPPEAVDLSAGNRTLVGKGSGIAEAYGIRYLVLGLRNWMDIGVFGNGVFTTGITGGNQAGGEGVGCSVLVNRILIVGGIAIPEIPVITNNAATTDR